MIGIYKITNKINGKCYIGQSINIEQRLKNHKSSKVDKPLYRAFKKYGIENFTFEILEQCKREELNEKEIKYIEIYNSTTDGNGYNLEHGGEFKDITLCEYSKKKQVENFKKAIKNMPKEDFEKWHKKIGEKHKGKTVSEEQRKKISKTLKEYYKDEKARERLSKNNKGKKRSLSARLKLSMSQQKVMAKYAKKVLQYDLENNFITSYDSLQDVKECNKFYNLGNISACCNNHRKTAYGFKWKYDEEFNSKNRKQSKRILKPPRELKGRPKDIPCRWKKVYQYDDKFNLIRVFNSFKEVESVFSSYKNVSACCRGQRTHAYGYRWSYSPIEK